MLAYFEILILSEVPHLNVVHLTLSNLKEKRVGSVSVDTQGFSIGVGKENVLCVNLYEQVVSGTASLSICVCICVSDSLTLYYQC